MFQLDLASIVQAMAGAGARSHALAACLLLPLPQRIASVEVLLEYTYKYWNIACWTAHTRCTAGSAE